MDIRQQIVLMPLPADIICCIGEFYIENYAQYIEYLMLSRDIYNRFRYHRIHLPTVIGSQPDLYRFSNIIVRGSMDYIKNIVQIAKPTKLDISMSLLCGEIDQALLDNLVYFNCSCNNITGVIRSNTIKYLIIDHTNIRTVSCPNLRTLNCAYIKWFKLPIDSPKLEHLTCDMCFMYGELPQYPLKSISAYNNPLLTGKISKRINYYIYGTSISLH